MTNPVSEILHQVVAEKGGDYIYERAALGQNCFYSDPNDHTAPSCIVGHVLAKLDPEAFGRVAQEEAFEGGSFGVLSIETSVWGASEAVALQAAQDVQDAGYAWSVAEKAFDYVMENGGSSYDAAMLFKDKYNKDGSLADGEEEDVD